MGHDAFHDLGHVGFFISAGVGDAQIQAMGAAGGLFTRHLDNAVPVLGQQDFAELFTAVCVGTFADEKRSRILTQRLTAEQRGDSGRRFAVAAGRQNVCQYVGKPFYELGRGAAAAADQAHRFFFHHDGKQRDEFIHGQGVRHLSVDVLRHTGVGLTGHAAGELPADLLDIGPHGLWSGGAVHAQDVNVKGREDGEYGVDLRAQQQGAGGFHSDRHAHRQLHAVLFHGVLYGEQAGFNLQHILTGFNEKQIDAALDEADRLFQVGAMHGSEIGLSEADEPGAGAHGTGDKAGTVREGSGGPARNAGRGAVDFYGFFRQLVFCQHDAAAAEGVGLHHLGACGKIVAVNGLNFFRSREIEDFVAADFSRPFFLSHRQTLNLRAHGAVEEDNPVILQAIKKSHASLMIS
ncbi:MAG: hypothetical protein BWY83_01554 [bacterium ADurb.Bin478]|nr:MAG: hypothetical protein BWY83_01554 [bacterium ADurb.Bin478]